MKRRWLATAAMGLLALGACTPPVPSPPEVKEALVATPAMAPVPAEEGRWYIAHDGNEPCVPLDDIDIDSGRRLYYGAGDLHTPADYAAKSNPVSCRPAAEFRGRPVSHKQSPRPSIWVTNRGKS
jgi:hypothetical protein